MAYCEDFPCCGHTRLDPCPGQGVVMTSEEAQEHYWCDDCGFAHVGPCPAGDPDAAEVEEAAWHRDHAELCAECGEEAGNHASDCELGYEQRQEERQFRHDQWADETYG